MIRIQQHLARVGSVRRRMMFSSILILVLMSTAMFYTATISIQLSRKVEVLFRNNLQMWELRLALNATGENLRAYLFSKSSEKLRDYIQYSTQLREQNLELNQWIYDNELMLLQRTLHRSIVRYLEFTELSIKAKRGRDVRAYSKTYDESERVLGNCLWIINSIENQFWNKSLRAFQSFHSILPSVIQANVILVLVSLAFSISLIVYYSGKLTFPLSQLAKAATAVGQGKYENDLPQLQGNDEVAVVSRAFAAMQANVQAMFSELRNKSELERMVLQQSLHNLEMSQKLKDAELLALQTQINPHFLFNTLAAGMQLALVEQAESTVDFLENLAEFMRYSLKNPSRTVRLADELEGISRYLWLLRLRFGDRYKFIIEVDTTLFDVQIPALLLQPLVENSITHGLKDRESGGFVVIRSRAESKMVYLDVEDNGIGMDDDKIRSIMSESVDESDLPHAHIGLHNVIRRHLLSTRNLGTIRIDSKLGCGTTIRIGIPV